MHELYRPTLPAGATPHSRSSLVSCATAVASPQMRPSCARTQGGFRGVAEAPVILVAMAQQHVHHTARLHAEAEQVVASGRLKLALHFSVTHPQELGALPNKVAVRDDQDGAGTRCVEPLPTEDAATQLMRAGLSAGPVGPQATVCKELRLRDLKRAIATQRRLVPCCPRRLTRGHAGWQTARGVRARLCMTAVFHAPEPAPSASLFTLPSCFIAGAAPLLAAACVWP
mmetsp:Transcript_37499/g.121187  ORF Transcript_37499/g.121187 Transcript_37499/m.121187 type:complete len:228 (+) Transcript_37499:239-922(+)